MRGLVGGQRNFDRAVADVLDFSSASIGKRRQKPVIERQTADAQVEQRGFSRRLGEWRQNTRRRPRPRRGRAIACREH
jgi:hypothetical protein